MLASFLLTPKQQRLFAPLMLRPDHSFSLSELLEAAGGGRSSVQSYIKHLADAGVVTIERPRNTARYKTNTDHPLYPELHRIAVKSFGIREPLVQGLQPFLADIEYAFVFGSYAKGTDRSDSDIDVMVVGNVRAFKIESALGDVREKLGRPIHVNAYLPAEWADMKISDSVVRSISEGPKIELVNANTRT